MGKLNFESGLREGFAKDSDAVTQGWVPAGIGFEGDHLDVGGCDPWSETPWKPLHEWVVVAHPEHPAQRSRADVYQLIGLDGLPVTFAATELSNGIWGFFVPADLNR